MQSRKQLVLLSFFWVVGCSPTPSELSLDEGEDGAESWGVALRDEFDVDAKSASVVDQERAAERARAAQAQACQGAGGLKSLKFQVNGGPVVAVLGALQPGDTVKVWFTVPAGCDGVEATLVTYKAPNAGAANLHLQQLFDVARETVSTGEHALEATLPGCHWQIDLVTGPPILQFDPSNGVTYSAQGRLAWAKNSVEGGAPQCELGEVKENQFSFDQKHDFLFVLDNSVSMKKDMKKVRAGLRALEASDFPADSKVAVMTTLPERLDPKPQPKVHPDVDKYPGINLEPGFVRLVDRAGWKAFRGQANLPADIRARYPLKPCEQAWFSPKEQHPQGHLCFEAATQTSLHGVGCEAGLTAYRQMVERAGPNLFRAGAAVHVVFISDTHDPGCRSPSLLAAPGRSYDALRDLTRRTNPSIASLDLSGIVPASERSSEEACAEPYSNYQGATYRPVVEDSGGKLINICEASDYAPVLKQIFQSTSATFALTPLASRVLEVRVNGAPHPAADWAFDPARNEVTVRNLSTLAANQVQVRFVAR